ncbi:MAG TPA: haloacid dehalogenase [Euryarchaeota archaeon]|nr:haloacid dehalogenase [Euryarchaeota archaeon]
MGDNMKLRYLVSEIKDELDLRDARREKVFILAREVRRFSTKAVRELHKANFEAAESAIEQAEKKLLELESGDYSFSLLQEAIQEYAEAVLTMSFLEKREPPSHKELGIPGEWYLLGLADTVGELRRHILDLIRLNKYSEVNHYLDLMDEITHEILTLDYPSAVLNIRRKQDISRSILERTFSDVVRAEKEIEVIRKLEELRH